MTYKGVVSQQKDTLPKENCMNKKFIAFTLVLLIAMGGLFAELPSYSAATAFLIGTIGDSFSHGFLIGTSTAYQTGETIPGDAFDAPAVLKYGFTAKHGSAFKSQLSVSKFTDGDGNDVNIASVAVLVGDTTTTTTVVTDDTKIDVLTYATDDVNTTVKRDATITVTPGSLEGAPAGEYTSTVTVNLITVS